MLQTIFTGHMDAGLLLSIIELEDGGMEIFARQSGPTGTHSTTVTLSPAAAAPVAAAIAEWHRGRAAKGA